MENVTYYYIVLPMSVLVLFTFLILLLLFRSRIRALDAGEVSVGFFKTYVGDDEPEQSRKLSRHLTNLFEAPVLFYVVCLAALSIQLSSILFHVLAWAYVIVRFLHAFIHLGNNKVPHRLIAYFTGWLVLLCMWATLVYEVLTH